MNRNEFLIVTCLSALVAILLIVQVVVARMAGYEQTQVYRAQQYISQGEVCLKNLKQVALRTAQLSQQKDDQGLKDLMARNQIAIGNPNQGADGSAQAAPAPESTSPAPTPTH